MSGVRSSPSWARLVSSDEPGTISAVTGQPAASLPTPGHRIHALAFSADGQTLAAALTGVGVRRWNIKARQELPRLSGDTGQTLNLAIGPDGRILATAHEDGTVKLWDAVEGRPLATYRAHSGPALGVAFASDGRRLASAGADGKVRFWAIPNR